MNEKYVNIVSGLPIPLMIMKEQFSFAICAYDAHSDSDPSENQA